MSRTLFVYIFRDLLRVFFMTSGALAGIMSFGGLLRPLTEHGLDAGQVGKVLTYFMPAMTTYSLPVAALFATTVVYGRLAADNEITAMRAAGIPFAWWPWNSMMLPAWILGITVSIISTVFLCFVVPNFSLEVERVIYSNLARLIANEIDRTRQIRHEDHTIYAQSAVAQPFDPKQPNNQAVTLNGVMIVSYEKAARGGADRKLQVPAEFYLARSATILIHRGGREDEEYTVEIVLDDGLMFPRTRAGRMQAGMSSTSFGPIPIDSPILEKSEYMDIRRLHELSADPTKSRRIREELTRIIRADQAALFLEEVAAGLSGRSRLFRFAAGGDGKEVFELTRGAEKPQLRRGRDALIVRGAKWVEERNGTVTSTSDVEEVVLTARAMPDGRMSVSAELHGAVRRTDAGVIGKRSIQRPFNVAMSPAVAAIANRSVKYYVNSGADPAAQAGRDALIRETMFLSNGVESEMHGRASFAVSCLILVLVGAALGMMFKSGNFLTAFAISVVPALLCIALIVTGQHTCENLPWKIPPNFENPLKAGIALIWSGNAAVALLAAGLMTKLQRT